MARYKGESGAVSFEGTQIRSITDMPIDELFDGFSVDLDDLKAALATGEVEVTKRDAEGFHLVANPDWLVRMRNKQVGDEYQSP